MNCKRAERLVPAALVLLMIAGCSEPAATSTPLLPEGRYQETVFDSAACEKDIAYREAEDQSGNTVELLLDVYQPTGDTETNRPAIVILHAGSFVMGAKDAGLEPVLAKGLAREGYVAVPINYRLSPNPITDWDRTLADATEDAAAAISWLRDNSEQYGVDPERIAVLGYSAGSLLAVHLVYNEGSDAGDIQCVVALSGGYSSGLLAPQEGDPPCLCVHGTEDKTISCSLGEKLYQTLLDAGVEAVFYPVQGADHDLYPYFDEVLNVVADYLYQIIVLKA